MEHIVLYLAIHYANLYLKGLISNQSNHDVACHLLEYQSMRQVRFLKSTLQFYTMHITRVILWQNWMSLGVHLFSQVEHRQTVAHLNTFQRHSDPSCIQNKCYQYPQRHTLEWFIANKFQQNKQMQMSCSNKHCRYLSSKYLLIVVTLMVHRYAQ